MLRLSVVMEIPGKEPREFEYEFAQDRITLGRDEHNDIQIPLSTVSRSHAEIFRDGQEWFIQDLKSTHGSKHNGKPLPKGSKKLLRTGDKIEIVHFSITLELDSAQSEDYSAEHTEALARKMVEEVLASIGTEELPYVRVMNGPDEGRKFELRPDLPEVVIGRGTDCDFQINDANISRRHAIIRRDWSDITIEDLGSKNGVVVNDKKVSKTRSLRDADEILLGAVRLTFIDPSAKFIGKLDDIPAFAQPESEEAPEEEEEPEESVVEEPPPPEPEPPENTMDQGPPEPMSEMSDGGFEPSLDGVTDGEGLEGEGEEGEEGAKPKKKSGGVKKGLGAFEIGLIVGMTLVVLGVLGGVAYLVLS